MNSSYGKRIGILVLVATIVAIALSIIGRVPYLFTFMGVAFLVLVGHVVTVDDDMPGGWSNPDGVQRFPWRELVLKAAVLVVLCVVALVFPSIRALGGR